MATVKDGYAKKSVAVKTASGKDSAVRSLDPVDSVVITDEGREEKVVQAVTNYVLNDTREKDAKAAKEKDAVVIRAYAGQVRDDNALSGEYQKSYRIMGTEVKKFQHAVDATQTDKWTLPKSKEDIEALRKVLGVDFDTIMEKETVISIKKEVLENDALRKELNALLHKVMGADDLRKYFEKDEVWRVKKGMAERQYKLTDTVRKAFRASVKLAADSLKDASEMVE
jgi:hypothetical protein